MSRTPISLYHGRGRAFSRGMVELSSGTKCKQVSSVCENQELHLPPPRSLQPGNTGLQRGQHSANSSPCAVHNKHSEVLGCGGSRCHSDGVWTIHLIPAFLHVCLSLIFFPLTPLVRVPGPSHACLKEVTEENLKQIMREMKNTTGPIWKKEYQCMKTKYRNWMIQSGAIIKIFKCVNGTCMNFRTL